MATREGMRSRGAESRLHSLGQVDRPVLVCVDVLDNDLNLGNGRVHPERAHQWANHVRLPVSFAGQGPNIRLAAG